MNPKHLGCSGFLQKDHNKTKVESVQLGKILNFSVFPPFPRPRVKCWEWDGKLGMGGGLLLRLGLVYIPNLSLLLILESLEKFLCGGGGGV